MAITCCRYCTEETGRHAGCHGSCQEYLKEKEFDEQKKNEEQQRKIYSIIPKRDRKVPQS